MAMGKIHEVVALRTPDFFFVHVGELLFDVPKRKKKDKRKNEKEFEGQYKKRRTERKHHQ